MKNSQLEEYRGSLTPAEAADGINAARKNARRLLSDAELLLELERYPTAATLAALSIEESGKVSILRSVVLENDPEQLRKEWKRYRDHRSKNGAWILPELAAMGARHLGELSAVVDRNGEHTAILNSVKQIGLYTDCYTKGHWSEPERVINAELARSLVKIAAVLMGKDEPVTIREMELWVEFLGPSLRTPDMANALLRWATAMFQEGLSTTTPEKFARFVFGESAATDMHFEPTKAQ